MEKKTKSYPVWDQSQIILNKNNWAKLDTKKNGCRVFKVQQTVSAHSQNNV